jgi:hypothetical protein
VETYVHHLPGRLRVRSDRAKNPVVARSLDETLGAMPGVSSVRVNVTTGSVLVHYNVAQINATALLQTLRMRNLPPASTPPPALLPPHSRIRNRRSHPPVRLAVRVRRKVVRTAFDYLVERAFERATILLLAAIF